MFRNCCTFILALLNREEFLANLCLFKTEQISDRFDLFWRKMLFYLLDNNMYMYISLSI